MDDINVRARGEESFSLTKIRVTARGVKNHRRELSRPALRDGFKIKRRQLAERNSPPEERNPSRCVSLLFLFFFREQMSRDASPSRRNTREARYDFQKN